MVFLIIRKEGKNTSSYPMTIPIKLSVLIKKKTTNNKNKKFKPTKTVVICSCLTSKVKVTGTVSKNNIKKILFAVKSLANQTLDTLVEGSVTLNTNNTVDNNKTHNTNVFSNPVMRFELLGSACLNKKTKQMITDIVKIKKNKI